MLAFGSAVGGLGRVTGPQVVNDSTDILRFASGVGGFGRVTGRQVVLA
jgi:hypothetical protein